MTHTPAGTFPRKVFYRIVLSYCFLIAISLFLAGVCFWGFVAATGGTFPWEIFILLTLIGLGSVGISFWIAKRLVFPLGRMLFKTRSIAADQPEIVTREDLDREVFDEWVDLESHIDDIKRHLLAKTQSLSMEQVELDTIMGSIREAILAVDPQGNALFFNSRFEVLFTGKEGRNRPMRLWTLFRSPEILSAFQECLKGDKAVESASFSVDSSEGQRRFFSLSVSPLRRADGVLYGAVGVFHDVTDLKAAEQMRIDFVANVSHELRTPLTVIKGFADTLALEKDLAPLFRTSIDSIVRNSNRLMNLMNDLLDLSSLESESFLSRETLETESITQRVLQTLLPSFENKDQLFEASYSQTTVYADAHRVEQVLTNLLTNAHKYTPKGGKVFLSWERESDCVVLKVADTGPGIPKEHLARLFERFYRVDKARSREEGGTGLGLAIVKHIMQRHGGSVGVESEPGRGTTFFCRFPTP